MAIPTYIQRWFDSLPEEKKYKVMENIRKTIMEDPIIHTELKGEK